MRKISDYANLALFLLALVIMMGGEAHAQKGKEFHFESDSAAHPIALLHDLVANIKRYPQVQRFTGEKGINGPHYSQGATIIYDRRRQVLWFENTTRSWGDIYPDSPTNHDQEQSYSLQRMKYFHVTPAKLAKILKVYIKKLDIQDDGTFYFPHLLEDGCRRRILIDTKKTWREKWIDNGKGGYFVKIRK